MRGPGGVLLAGGAAFLALAAVAVLVGVPPADVALREALLGLAAPPVVRAMRVVNYLGDKVVLIPATLALILAVPRARARWWIWAGLMVAAPLAEGLTKLLVERPRPVGQGLAFPSGHATAAAAYFGALIHLAGPLAAPLRRLVRLAAALAIVLVGAARILLEAHWPADVAAGIALGLALAAAASLLAARQDPGAGG